MTNRSNESGNGLGNNIPNLEFWVSPPVYGDDDPERLRARKVSLSENDQTYNLTGPIPEKSPKDLEVFQAGVALVRAAMQGQLNEPPQEQQPN